MDTSQMLLNISLNDDDDYPGWPKDIWPPPGFPNVAWLQPPHQPNAHFAVDNQQIRFFYKRKDIRGWGNTNHPTCLTLSCWDFTEYIPP